MDLKKMFLLSLTVTLAFLMAADGRLASRQRPKHHPGPRWTPAASNLVEFDLTYDFSVPGETRSMSFVVVVPTTTPGRQKILSRSYSPRPSRIFNENGNRYAEFVFREPQRHENVKIHVKAELYRYDLLSAKGETAEELAEDDRREDFLKQERYIESDHDEIRQIAAGLEGDTETDVVKQIYDYVLDHMEYVKSGKDDKGAIVALERGKGDCTEYADLFVAICRARDIPARVVTGYTVQADTTTSKHNWAEVYLQDRGWVPFDPAAGDMESPIFRNRAFGRMRPVYIYFSHIRNDYVLDSHNFGTYRYTGDRVRLTDSVEFKFPAPSTAESR
jgi:transglutaminase-like putative cysteine protease